MGTIPSEGVVTILVRGWALFLVRGWALFLVRGDQDTIPLCHGDVGRGRLARTYASREGDMSWCIMAYCYGIG